MNRADSILIGIGGAFRSGMKHRRHAARLDRLPCLRAKLACMLKQTPLILSNRLPVAGAPAS
ncbi:MAG: hypothetical protein ACRECV_06555 [Xanthobacteraceae bacterium]